MSDAARLAYALLFGIREHLLGDGDEEVGKNWIAGAACVVALVTVGALPASAVPTAPDVSEHVLIGTVTGDSLADILERSEPLNEPGQLAPYLDSLAFYIASGEVGEALGLENLPVEEALVLVAHAKESIATDQPFSDAVENFRAGSEAEVEYVQDAPDGVVAAPFSSDDPSTPSEYNVWGQAYNSNRSWKLDLTFKL